MKQFFEISQIVVSFFLILAIILQNKSEGVGRAFGTETSSFSTRRGVEKTLYILTTVSIVFFLVSSIVNFVL